MFAQRGPILMALAALLVASSSFAQRSSGYSTVSESLSVVDITLEAPVNAQTCEPVSFEWTWSGLGEEPSDPVSLSIINASDFGRRRKRASNRSHIDLTPTLLQRKRADTSAYSIPGASSIAFDEETFEWTTFAVAPGSYRLLLTVDESSQSVVSDPFTVSSGTDTSCLTSSSAFSSTSASPEEQSSDGALTSTSTNPVASQSSASEASRTSAPASSSVSATTGSSSSSSSVATGSTQASSGASNTSSNSSSSSSSSSGSSTNAGGIAAGILVPLLLLGGGALFWRWYKSRQATAGRLAGQSPGSSWSEKFFGGSNGAAADGSHGISGPTAATRSGLAAVAALVPEELRTEKEAAALRAEAAKTSRSRPQSGASQSTNGDAAHWIDFASDDGHNVDGARPLSPSTIDDAARHSVEQLYQQGRNVPLSQTYSRGDLSHLHDSLSTIGAPSSGHRTISTFGTPAADADTDADEVGSLRQLRIDAMDTQRSSTLTASTVGRDLIAAMPQPPRTTTTDAQSPFGDDQAVAVAPSIAATSPAPGLERAGSTGSIFKSKRKAVPRLSAGEPVTTAKDPFSDSTDSAIAEHPLARSATPTPTPAATLEAPSTPRQQQSTLRHAATPRNVPHTPRAESIISEEEHEEVLSESNAVIDDEAAERARQYHLSLNLPIDSDAGFRVSFS